MPPGRYLSTETIRASSFTDPDGLNGAGVYAIVIGEKVFIGESSVLAVRFNSHLTGHSIDIVKLAAAKAAAKTNGVAIETLGLVKVPIPVPATIRHVFETFVNVRAQATGPMHLTVNVFDMRFYRRSQTISGREIMAFLAAIKEHLAGAGAKLPTAGSPRWTELFGDCFAAQVSPNYLSQIAAGSDRKLVVSHFKVKLGLVIADNDWEGRVRQAPTVPAERRLRAETAKATLSGAYSSRKDEAEQFAGYGLGRAKKRRLR